MNDAKNLTTSDSKTYETTFENKNSSFLFLLQCQWAVVIAPLCVWLYTCAPSPVRFCLRLLYHSRSAHLFSPPRAAHRPSLDLALAPSARNDFFPAIGAAGALRRPDDFPYVLSVALLCAAWLLLQRRICAHLPHWRVLRWRRCAECVLLPLDGLHCRGAERAAAVLLECVKSRVGPKSAVKGEGQCVGHALRVKLWQQPNPLNNTWGADLPRGHFCIPCIQRSTRRCS